MFDIEKSDILILMYMAIFIWIRNLSGKSLGFAVLLISSFSSELKVTDF